MANQNRQSTPRPPEPTKVQNTVEELPEKDSTVNQQQQGGFGQGRQDNLLDNDFVQPDVSQKPIEPASNNFDFSSVLAEQFANNPAFSALVQQAVTAQLQRMQGDGRHEQRFVEASQQSDAAVKPDFNYLKHYRNDASPELVIQELDMSKDRPQLHPIPGRVIRFRRGHFFATTENQVQQIDTLTNTPSHSADQRNALGGIVGIYEDDGEVLYHCSAGCGYDSFVPTSSHARYKAHMRAIHNVEVS
jgi:hypothetical protein